MVKAEKYEGRSSVVLNSKEMNKLSIIILTKRIDRTYSKDKLNKASIGTCKCYGMMLLAFASSGKKKAKFTYVLYSPVQIRKTN